MSGEQHDAVIEQVRAQAIALREAYQARDILVAMLGLEPVSGRPGGRATWDDVVTYVGKALGTRDLLMRTVERRSRYLADALGVEHGTLYPTMLTRVRELVERIAHRP